MLISLQNSELVIEDDQTEERLKSSDELQADNQALQVDHQEELQH
jgi:hypothetical protein